MAFLEDKIANMNPNSVVKIKVIGSKSPSSYSYLNNKFLRSIAPDTMNIDISIPISSYQNKKR